MLLGKTKIGPSKISGIGLFADEFISKGAPVWKFQKGFDLEISRDFFASLPTVTQEQILNYCYFNSQTNMFIVCSDDARFFNHSDEPNVSSSPSDNDIDVALRDIALGEELTQDYKVFDGSAAFKLISAVEPKAEEV